MSFRAIEYEDGSLVVSKGDVVMLSNNSSKNGGVFARVGASELLEGNALVGFYPEINDKRLHRSTTGRLSPSTTSNLRVVLKGKTGEFEEGGFSVHVPNRIDKIRYNVGRRLLGR